ncbi:cyclin-dependent kinase 11B-like isoform X2 [Pomacea canaliculata]|nr:cyclin-dependent kinase 11B-like isoform X2 [Pomacea canaliculata]
MNNRLLGTTLVFQEELFPFYFLFVISGALLKLAVHTTSSLDFCFQTKVSLAVRGSISVMSESSSSSPNSPYEQGELKSSPEHPWRHSREDHEHERLSLSPRSQEALDDLNEDKEKKEVIEIMSDDGEVERDSLHIKPPQAQAGNVRREKSHKHKHKTERRREKQRPRDRERYRRGADYHRAIDAKDRGIRGFKDAREMLRERQKEKEKRAKDVVREDVESKEDRERKESLKERERLEELERKRQRERRLREEREKADKQRRKEEERRMQQRGEVTDLVRREKAVRNDRGADRPDYDRNRSKLARRHRGDRDRSDIRSQERSRSRKQEEEEKSFNSAGEDRQGWRQTEEFHSDGEKQASKEEPREEEEEEEEQEEEDEEDENMEEPSSPQHAAHSEEEPEHRTPEHEDNNSNSSDEESDSESSRSSGSRSEHSSENDKRRVVHVRSKFDNESEEEREEGEKHSHRSPTRSPVSDDTDHRNYVEDSPPQSPVELAEELPPYYPAIQGCRSVEEFHCLNRIEEGTFGVVYRARDKKTGEIVALKRLKMEKEKEGFPITSLREINTLLKAQHTNIVTVREIVVGSNMDKIYIVMDYVEHDLKSLMETLKSPFLVGEVKTLMKQLLRAVAHLHDNWILHRDLKTSNLLLSHKGILKVGDFGLAREYGSPLKHYTPIVVTLWYRAPELLLGTKEYSCPIDLWSVGCIFAEFLTLKALWPGKSEIDQLNRIFKDLGTPNEKIWTSCMELPGMKKCTFTNYPYNSLRNRFSSVVLSDLGFDLLNRFLTYDPKKRIDAKTALEHKYFAESPLPVDPSMFPTWPARSEQTRGKHVSSPKPPSGGKAFAKLMDDDETLAAGFHMDTAVKGASAQGHGFQLKF